MAEKLKILARYLYAYKVYGLYLYVLVYWLKRSKIKLPGYGIINIRHNTFDVKIFNQMFIYRQYNFEIAGDIKVIFDLGANNGMSALFFHKKYPNATIYALEPEASNFAAFQTNTKGITSIIGINKAIWKSDGLVNLDSGDSWAVKVDMVSGTNTVESVTMDSLISTYQIKQIDLLKIDIETAEKELFEASTQFLTVTRNLLIELHDWLRPGCSQAFFRALYNYRYQYAVNIENTIITDLQLDQQIAE
jgi:FkbM family methyltransferase